MGSRVAGVLLLFLTVSLVLVAVPGCQRPQTPGSTEMERLSKRIEQLAEKIDKFSDQAVTKPDLAEAGKKWATKEEVDEVKSGLRITKSDLSAHMEAVAQLHFEQEKLAETVKRQFPAIEEKLAEAKTAAKAHTDAVNEKTLSEVASLNSRTDRIDARVLGLEERLGIPAEHPAVAPPSAIPPLFGILVIDNRMDTWQRLRVNGVDYWIAPFSTQNVWVPVGDVTTELVSWESARRITVGAPSYLRKLIITPRHVQWGGVIWE
jgi:gas vesicle protein